VRISPGVAEASMQRISGMNGSVGQFGCFSDKARGCVQDLEDLILAQDSDDEICAVCRERLARPFRE